MEMEMGGDFHTRVRSFLTETEKDDLDLAIHGPSRKSPQVLSSSSASVGLLKHNGPFSISHYRSFEETVKDPLQGDFATRTPSGSFLDTMAAARAMTTTKNYTSTSAYVPLKNHVSPHKSAIAYVPSTAKGALSPGKRPAGVSASSRVAAVSRKLAGMEDVPGSRLTLVEDTTTQIRETVGAISTRVGNVETRIDDVEDSLRHIDETTRQEFEDLSHRVVLSNQVVDHLQSLLEFEGRRHSEKPDSFADARESTRDANRMSAVSRLRDAEKDLVEIKGHMSRLQVDAKGYEEKIRNLVDNHTSLGEELRDTGLQVLQNTGKLRSMEQEQEALRMEVERMTSGTDRFATRTMVEPKIADVASRVETLESAIRSLRAKSGADSERIKKSVQTSLLEDFQAMVSRAVEEKLSRIVFAAANSCERIPTDTDCDETTVHVALPEPTVDVPPLQGALSNMCSLAGRLAHVETSMKDVRKNVDEMSRKLRETQQESSSTRKDLVDIRTSCVTEISSAVQSLLGDVEGIVEKKVSAGVRDFEWRLQEAEKDIEAEKHVRLRFEGSISHLREDLAASVSQSQEGVASLRHLSSSLEHLASRTHRLEVSSKAFEAWRSEALYLQDVKDFATRVAKSEANEVGMSAARNTAEEVSRRISRDIAAHVAEAKSHAFLEEKLRPHLVAIKECATVTDVQRLRDQLTGIVDRLPANHIMEKVVLVERSISEVSTRLSDAAAASKRRFESLETARQHTQGDLDRLRTAMDRKTFLHASEKEDFITRVETLEKSMNLAERERIVGRVEALEKAHRESFEKLSHVVDSLSQVRGRVESEKTFRHWQEELIRRVEKMEGTCVTLEETEGEISTRAERLNASLSKEIDRLKEEIMNMKQEDKRHLDSMGKDLRHVEDWRRHVDDWRRHVDTKLIHVDSGRNLTDRGDEDMRNRIRALEEEWGEAARRMRQVEHSQTNGESSGTQGTCGTCCCGGGCACVRAHDESSDVLRLLRSSVADLGADLLTLKEKYSQLTEVRTCGTEPDITILEKKISELDTRTRSSLDGFSERLRNVLMQVADMRETQASLSEQIACSSPDGGASAAADVATLATAQRSVDRRVSIVDDRCAEIRATFSPLLAQMQHVTDKLSKCVSTSTVALMQSDLSRLSRRMLQLERTQFYHKTQGSRSRYPQNSYHSEDGCDADGGADGGAGVGSGAGADSGVDAGGAAAAAAAAAGTGGDGGDGGGTGGDGDSGEGHESAAAALGTISSSRVPSGSSDRCGTNASNEEKTSCDAKHVSLSPTREDATVYQRLEEMREGMEQQASTLEQVQARMSVFDAVDSEVPWGNHVRVLLERADYVMHTLEQSVTLSNDIHGIHSRLAILESSVRALQSCFASSGEEDESE